MKGRFELSINAILIVVALMGTFIMIILVFTNMGTTAKVMKGSINKLNGIDATHIIENCLKDENDIILIEFLDENKRKNVCEICGICETVVEFKVEDMETDDTWKFDYSNIRHAWKWLVDKITFWNPDTTHTESKIIISLETEDGEVHIGKLYVWS